jgi:catechol 2,3-dioxygenase-like lactoylglutathione lyase family enzyme
MIGYVTLGTNDLARAAKFYDELLAVVGAKRRMSGDRFVSWATDDTSPGFGVGLPFDGKDATVGNGTMVALKLASQEQVKALYDEAMALGGKDEGPPGLRFGTFYAAYFRDLDGNKLNAFHFPG